MKRRSIKVFLPVAIITFLVVIIGLLYAKNNQYKLRAEKLFLKYDSITSANIELKDTLRKISDPMNKRVVSVREVKEKDNN